MRVVFQRAHRTIIGVYLRIACRIWWRLPVFLRSFPVFLAIGTHLHSLVLRHGDRRQNHSTFFLRNRPELELIKRLASGAPHGSTLCIAVFACSKGAEVYSLAWALRCARPDLTINMRGIDISREILDFASNGVYSVRASENQGLNGAVRTEELQLNWYTHKDQRESSIVCRMSESERDMMFDREGDYLRVKSCMRSGISWHCADAADRNLVSRLGYHDMVIANRFLCHMRPAAAEFTLRSIAQMVKPGGYLFVSGIDLDVRERVAIGSNWKPVTELMHEIHEGDPSLRNGWPFDYWAKEPFQPQRKNAAFRYAGAFQVQ
jgi:chemotaxis methyl-accepting protein methylase